jgi:glycosyltransferase involved in cell wall biosynthesis
VPRGTDLRIVHISAARYTPCDRGHVTYGIWQELASGFGTYHVIGRSDGSPAEWTDGNLTVTLIRSKIAREAEFLATQFRLIPRLVRERPDVIVCQSPVLGGLAAVAAARRTGSAVLSELHGAEFFRDAPFGSRDWLLKLMARFSLKHSTSIRVLTRKMRERLASTYGDELLPKARVLPPRVDLARFSQRSDELGREGPLRIATVGAVNANKGQLRLIRALENIPFRCELHVIGAGPHLGWVQENSTRRASVGSNLAVIAHGALPHAAVANVLQQCDALVMYSLSEGTPRAIMEAMAVGLLVISTAAGFCGDLFENGQEGYLLGEDPDNELVRLLELLNVDRVLLGRIGAAARARAERDYDSVRLFDAYRRLIEESASK